MLTPYAIGRNQPSGPAFPGNIIVLPSDFILMPALSLPVPGPASVANREKQIPFRKMNNSLPRKFLVHTILFALTLSVIRSPAGSGGQPGAFSQTQGGISVPVTGQKARDHLKTSGQYASIAAAYTAARYQVRQVGASSENRIVESPHISLLEAQNPAHRLNSRFSPEGLSLTVQTGNGPDVRKYAVGWRLCSLGYGEAQTPVLSGSLRSTEKRVELSRTSPAVTEWFNNEPAGLEHGFTLTERPAENPQGEPLRLVLAVIGDLVPQADADGQNLALRDSQGRIVLNYAKLKVWDATGTELPASMQVSATGGQVTLVVADATARYPLTIDPTFTQQAYLKASNPGGADPDRDFVNGDTFGGAVAVSGDTVVIGARGEDSNATGVNGDQTDNEEFGAGAVYIFVRSGDTWVQQAYLKASNTSSSDHFGGAVAISGDTVVIGALGEDSNATGVNGDQGNNDTSVSGAAYVFVRNGTTWTQQAYLKASNPGVTDFFGVSVAVSGDTVVIGAQSEDSNSKTINGNDSNNSAEDAGAAYVFARNGTTWAQQAYLKGSNTAAGDQFGLSVAVSGDRVVVGSHRDDSSAKGINGTAVDFDEDGIIDESTDSGAAFIFVRNGETWTQQAFLKSGIPSDNIFTDFFEFGRSVSISGDTVVVGAPEEFSNAGLGAAYVFIRSGISWSRQTRFVKTTGSDPIERIGHKLVISGDTLAISASENITPFIKVFQRLGTTWSDGDKFVASNNERGDAFGTSIGLSGNILVAGAPLEKSNASGIDGDASNNSLREAGAAYVFVLPTTSPAFPEIVVEQPSGTNLVDGGNQAFGNVIVGATTNRIFTVRNSGTANLTGLGILIDGPDAAMFTVTAIPTAPVTGPTGSATFTVQFAPTSAGVKTAALHIASNDADENPFDLTLTGEGTVSAPVNTPPTLTLPVSPIISEATSAGGAVVTFSATANDAQDGVLTPLVTPASGTTFPLGDTTVNVNATDSASATTNGSFIVRVVDTTAPTLSVPTGPVTVTATSLAGAVVTFTNRANDLVSGEVAAIANPPSGSTFPIGDTTVTVSATDSAGNVARGSFLVQVTSGPEISVEQPLDVKIADGATHAFGEVNVGSANSLTFIVKNLGTAVLTGLQLSVEGTNAAQFTVTSLPTAPVSGPEGSTTFTVQFAPTNSGTYSATLRIASNDTDENPFDILLTGSGKSPSSLAAIATVRWTPAGLLITIPVASGQNVGIQYSETLEIGSWIDIGTVTVTDGIGSFTDSDNLRRARSKGFYRAFLR